MTRVCPVCHEELLDGFDDPKAIYCSADCKQVAANARRRKKEAGKQRTPPQHGSRSMYVMGCREECCSSVQREYDRQRRGTQLPEWYKLWVTSDNTNEDSSAMVTAN